jgi:transposase
MATATQKHDSSSYSVLYAALELGAMSWKIATTVGFGQRPRLKSIRAGDVEALHTELAKAKKRFGLSLDTPVVTCYEAGRDGFWLHRALSAAGIRNHVVDSASIEVNRRQRRAKSDRLDAIKLAEMLMRYELGERRVWRVVQPPTPEQEDARQLHREIETLQHERRQLANRISSLLATVGISLRVNRQFGRRLPSLRSWDGAPLAAGLRSRLEREFIRWQLAHEQLTAAERQLRSSAREEASSGSSPLQNLLSLRGIGPKGAWLLLREGLVWRQFRNRREVASMVGLVPTPYHSGTLARERGISKAGNARLRKLLVELAWGWLYYQPESGLSQWYYQRFAAGNARIRKIGIVALARKLLVALWRCAAHGELPPGAQAIDWRSKFKRPTKVKPAAA